MSHGESDEELAKDLGLISAMTIGIGTMIGAGIFVLPGVAANEAGPIVVVSFVVGGMIAMVNALSVSFDQTDTRSDEMNSTIEQWIDDLVAGVDDAQATVEEMLHERLSCPAEAVTPDGGRTSDVRNRLVVDDEPHPQDDLESSG